MHRLWVSLAFGGLAASGLWPQAGEVRHLRIEPPSIVWMSAGSFVMGATDHDISYAVELCQGERPLPLLSFGPEMDGACSARRFVPEAPQRRVWTDGYGIDRTEVTHAAYRRCVTSGRCVPSRIADDDLRLAAPRMPVTGITWDEAAAYCRFAGGRLPTEAEWERAARGPRRHRFPWGRMYNSSLANHGRSPAGPDAGDGFAHAAPVGSFPSGASPHGLLDVAGNAWEWTASRPSHADVGPGADASVYRVVRGGSWAQPAEALRVTHRVWLPSAEQRSDLGVRCAYDAAPEGEPRRP
ncbi:MAG: formylglycine-generating enzyme family protein [Sandaracinaceae bacterium]|nr:formylglycine-generating enzyme family protein [Sandaracinaceae bacterium]